MHSVRPDKPVPPLIVELLTHVERATRELSLPYFVAGAFARDLLLMHVHGFDVARATRDVDIGVAVRGWADFDRVQAELIRTGEFSPVPDIAHRLRLRERPGHLGITLDVVPFRGVEEGDAVLRWPPGRDVVMSVVGFNEALQTAEEVQVTSELTVRVASLAGQALLKLVAWLDRRRETPRDAQDLLVIFRRYGDAGNQDRLFGERSALLERSEFDVEVAGAILLGEDARVIALPRSHDRLASAFAAPKVREKFVTHAASAAAFHEEDRVSTAQKVIDAFFSGFGTTKS